MQDYSVQNVQVQDIQGLDPQGQPTVTKRVTYNVGRNGPFFLNYTRADYTPEKVSADIQREVDTLKAIHATTYQH